MKNSGIRSLLSVAVIIIVGVLVALAGSQGSISVWGIPIFALGVGLAFLIQWIVLIPSYIYKTEKYFDLTGGFTYITVTATAFLLSEGADARAILLLVLVVIWAGRLGSFLFLRIRAAGEDRRFREIKKSFGRSLLTWSLQGLWVTITLSSALAAITSENEVSFGVFAWIGLLVWIIGFSIETTADQQKSIFRKDQANKGKFIRSGLWAWSRHPNYFGEIVLWIGIAIISFPVLRGWQLVSLISPVFVTLLLTKVSGIPMLESRADKKWGGQEDYEKYKNETSILIPLPPHVARKSDS